MKPIGHARPGFPCWVSLAAPSLQAAQKFYTAVLGWTWRPTGVGEEFRTALFGGAPVAACRSAREQPSERGRLDAVLRRGGRGRHRGTDP